MRDQAREYVIESGPALRHPIIGRIADKGLANELYDKGYLVIDAADGRAHYLALPPGMVLADFPTNGIVEVQPIPESAADRSEEHTSELQSLMRISYAVFCLQKKKKKQQN